MVELVDQQLLSLFGFDFLADVVPLDQDATDFAGFLSDRLENELQMRFRGGAGFRIDQGDQLAITEIRFGGGPDFVEDLPEALLDHLGQSLGDS